MHTQEVAQHLTQSCVIHGIFLTQQQKRGFSCFLLVICALVFYDLLSVPPSLMLSNDVSDEQLHKLQVLPLPMVGMGS